MFARALVTYIIINKDGIKVVEFALEVGVSQAICEVDSEIIFKSSEPSLSLS